MATSVGQEGLGARLHSDALSLVFHALCEDANPRDQKSSLVAPLTVAQVCRHWRAVAVAQSCLWAEFFWKPGDNIDAAFALLEMSRSAPMRMSVTLHKLRDDGDIESELDGAGTVTDAMLAEGHTVFRAAAAHLHRVTYFRLEFGVESLGSSSLAPFLGQLPCRMPRLRNINIAFCSLYSNAPSLQPLNIACPPLVSLALDRVLLKRMRRLVGPETLEIVISRLKVPYGELHSVFERSPNLQELSLLFCTISGDRLYPSPLGFTHMRAANANGPRVSISLKKINLFNFSREDVRRLQALLASALPRVRTVNVIMCHNETPCDAALDFLHISALADVTMIYVTRRGVKFYSHTANAAHQWHYIARKLIGDLPSLAFLRGAFAGGGTNTLSKLEELEVSLHCWTELMALFEAAGAAAPSAGLPELYIINLCISQDDFLRADMPAPYIGSRIIAPKLQYIDIEFSGAAPPTADVVQHYLHALSCVLPSMPCFNPGLVEIKYHDDHDGKHVVPFCELYNAEMLRLNPATDSVST